MKLERLSAGPEVMIDFFEEGLQRIGAVCERTWHDRLETVAEGEAARLWRPDGALHEVELRFLSPETSGERDAAVQVFPGCPLTFHLAEALWRQGPAAGRVVAPGGDGKPPAADVLSKMWALQHPGATHVSFGSLTGSWHFTLVAALRCEIQATSQHWSLHRLAVSWPGGERDYGMEADLAFLTPVPAPGEMIEWPAPPVEDLAGPIERALLEDLAADLAPIKARQERFLARELVRIDAYFANYAREIGERRRRSTRAESASQFEERLKAAREEHLRRREDQVNRHEIVVAAHVDALLWVCEPCWVTHVTSTERRETRTAAAHYLPRLRRWFLRM